MNNLNYFRAEGIFGQEEKVRKDSREEKREARIIEIKNSIEDGFVSFQKSNSHVQTDLSEIPKLKSEFNLLTFQNHQKSETLSRLKTEVQTLTSFHKTAHFKSQLTTPRNSVCNFQVSQLASFNLSLDEQEELIHKLNSEILKINSLIDSESLVSDQLEYMKTNEKGKHVSYI